MNLERLIEELLEREGGYVNHPNDRGGPTIYGITQAVARAHGYQGPMRSLPREEEAVAIYKRLYIPIWFATAVSGRRPWPLSTDS
jgi:lysozyme family protein